MGKFGINVPKGVAVSSIEEVRKAIQTTFPNDKEVTCQELFFCSSFIIFYSSCFKSSNLTCFNLE